MSANHSVNTHSYYGNEFRKDKHEVLAQSFVFQLDSSNCWNKSENKQHLTVSPMEYVHELVMLGFGLVIQWNLSFTTTSIMKFITCDLFSDVF